MKKKILAIVLGTCMVLSLVACSDKATDAESDTDSSTESSDDSASGDVANEDEPEILPVYLDLEVEAPGLHEVTEEDIDYEISFVLESNAELVEVTDRAVQDGDVVNLDYTGYMDGEAFENGADTGFDLTIGSGSFIPGFEEGLIGAEIGETLDVTATFPEPYLNNEAFSGKEATFTCVINSISENVIPELTDEFVKTISETVTTVDEFRADMKVQLEEYYANEYETTLQTAVWAKVVESVVVENYPASIVSGLEEQLRKSYEGQAEYYGMTMEELIAAYGLTAEDFDAYITEVAQQIYVSNRIVTYIADEQELNLTDEEYMEGMQEIATGYGYETVDDLLVNANEDDVKMDVLTDVVVQWLVENSTFVEAAE